jgi:uncharacterized membrane protein
MSVELREYPWALLSPFPVYGRFISGLLPLSPIRATTLGAVIVMMVEPVLRVAAGLAVASVD